jgi:hypothetical protein
MAYSKLGAFLHQLAVCTASDLKLAVPMVCGSFTAKNMSLLFKTFCCNSLLSASALSPKYCNCRCTVFCPAKQSSMQ